MIALLDMQKNSPALYRKLTEMRKSTEDCSKTPPSPKESEGTKVRRAASRAEERKEKGTLRASSSSSRSQQLETEQQLVFKDAEAYLLRNTLVDLTDVGQLRVQLVGAKGLYGADFNGKSDSFALVRLRDVEFRSKTIKKNINPVWNEEFVFPVKDISDILYITVWDEDRFNDPELLGQLAVPLLTMEGGSEEERRYALKDKKFESRAKGTHPQLVMKSDLHWNQARAAVRMIKSPDEPKKETFKKSLFIANVQRMRKVLYFLSSVNQFLQSCFEWESRPRSIKAFILFELTVYFFEPYMLPLVILAFIFIYPLYATDIVLDFLDPYCNLGTDDDDDDDEKDEGKKTITEKYKAVQEVTAYVQNTLGFMASTAERLKNVVNFSVPFMSWLAVAFLIGATLLLYWVPVRVLFMLYGVNKFSKKILRPNHSPSSEFFNFLSRLPDDPTLSKCKELSLFDQQLLKLEEEERQRREGSNSLKFAKKVSSFFTKSEPKEKDRKND